MFWTIDVVNLMHKKGPSLSLDLPKETWEEIVSLWLLGGEFESKAIRSLLLSCEEEEFYSGR